jgi:G3E family GTPase
MAAIVSPVGLSSRIRDRHYHHHQRNYQKHRRSIEAFNRAFHPHFHPTAFQNHHHFIHQNDHRPVYRHEGQLNLN